MNIRKRAAALLSALALILCCSAASAGVWYTFTEENVPERLAFLVDDAEYTGTVTLTFLGDCTMGGEEAYRNSSLGYDRYIRENGYGFPMRELSRLTSTDDITVANLEGVLTDRKLEKVDKEYNFSGPAAYTQILTGAGIECVTLANNHSHDYGNPGYADTKEALDAAGVAYFGTDCMAVWDSGGGLRIGFVGISFSLAGNRAKAFARQTELLRQVGCAAIVAVMHAGQEYSYKPNATQRAIADRAIGNSVSLVVGHHPHVVQGYEIRNGVPVVYSLGNCSFGGTTHAKDSDAAVLRTKMRFEAGRLAETVLRFYPISITSDARYNNYSPAFLTGGDAERVLKKLRESTGNGFEPFDAENGAEVVCPAP